MPVVSFDGIGQPSSSSFLGFGKHWRGRQSSCLQCLSCCQTLFGRGRAAARGTKWAVCLHDTGYRCLGVVENLHTDAADTSDRHTSSFEEQRRLSKFACLCHSMGTPAIMIVSNEEFVLYVPWLEQRDVDLISTLLEGFCNLRLQDAFPLSTRAELILQLHKTSCLLRALSRSER